MMFIPITTVLNDAMAGKSGGTVCTVGFNWILTALQRRGIEAAEMNLLRPLAG